MTIQLVDLATVGVALWAIYSFVWKKSPLIAAIMVILLGLGMSTYDSATPALMLTSTYVLIGTGGFMVLSAFISKRKGAE